MLRVAPGDRAIRLQLRGVRFAHGPHDHKAEKPADSDDGDEDSHGLGVHQLLGGASRSPSRCLASSRSVKSMRSPNSATSRRTCCISSKNSARSAASSSGVARRASPARRLASALTRGRITHKAPPTAKKANKAKKKSLSSIILVQSVARRAACARAAPEDEDDREDAFHGYSPLGLNLPS